MPTQMFLMFVVALLGLGLAAQPAINAAAARVFGSAIAAAAFSVAITLICYLPFVLRNAQLPSWATLTAAPWWVYIGGGVGAAFVAGSLVIIPQIGAAQFAIFLVLGQFIGAVLLDHFGLFGLDTRAITAPKAFGIAMVLLGALIVILAPKATS